MTMMAGKGLVVAMARAVVKGRRDFGATGRIGHVEIVQAMQHAREQICGRDEHGQEPAPIAQVEESQAGKS